jgi:hypothetical protein
LQDFEQMGTLVTEQIWSEGAPQQKQYPVLPAVRVTLGCFMGSNRGVEEGLVEVTGGCVVVMTG